MVVAYKSIFWLKSSHLGQNLINLKLESLVGLCGYQLANMGLKGGNLRLKGANLGLKEAILGLKWACLELKWALLGAQMGQLRA